MIDAQRLSEFAARLRKHGKVKLDHATVWKDFANTFPARAHGEERALLAQSLNALAEQGVLEFPAQAGRQWDRSMTPHLPKVIRVRSKERVPRAKAWKTHAWHPKLAWVVDLPYLPLDQESFLRRVNDALIRGELDETVPLKYRSLQLCQGEKELAMRMSSGLFGGGRLTPELLNAESEVLPLAWHAVRPGGRVLIVENAAMFHVARTALGDVAEPPYDVLAFGGGNSVLQSIPYLGSIGRPIESIDYCGDLDREGALIANGATAAARSAGLPALKPATRLHRLMLDQRATFGRPQGWKDDARPRQVATDPTLLRWYDAQVRTEVSELFDQGRRVPEEVVGPRELRRAWSR